MRQVLCIAAWFAGLSLSAAEMRAGYGCWSPWFYSPGWPGGMLYWGEPMFVVDSAGYAPADPEAGTIPLTPPAMPPFSRLEQSSLLVNMKPEVPSNGPLERAAQELFRLRRGRP